MAYAVIAENDESKWDDDTGVLYHFPKRYSALLKPGTRVVYYTGRQKNAAYASRRLSAEPHYFGTATIAKVFGDRASGKGDLFATIEDYEAFGIAVPTKQGAQYLEVIPASRANNHWRDGVRSTDLATFQRIVTAAGLAPIIVSEGDLFKWSAAGNDLESDQEGSVTLRYVTTYERNPRYRRQAIAIHGLRCMACDLDMGEIYGPLGEGLIHVHHVEPVSTFEAPKRIDPACDLVPVCPNCHSVIHRKKTSTLSITALRAALGKS